MIQRERSRWFPSEFRGGRCEESHEANKTLYLASENERLNFAAKLGVGVCFSLPSAAYCLNCTTLTRHKGLDLILLPVEHTGGCGDSYSGATGRLEKWLIQDALLG